MAIFLAVDHSWLLATLTPDMPNMETVPPKVIERSTIVRTSNPEQTVQRWKKEVAPMTKAERVFEEDNILTVEYARSKAWMNGFAE